MMQSAVTLLSTSNTSNKTLRWLTNTLYRKDNLFLLLLLTLPLLWFCVVYLGSLLALLWQSFYTFDNFSMLVTPDLILENFRSLLDATNFDIILRTLTMAVNVTIATALIGFPIAYYITCYVSPAEKGFFYVAVILPMWASYIVKAYAWTVILSQQGVLYWRIHHLGLVSALNYVLQIPNIGGNTLATSNLGVLLYLPTFGYRL